MADREFILEESDFTDKPYSRLEQSEVAIIGDKVYHAYGMTFATITEDDIKALRDGKVIIYDVECCEYRIAIKLGR